MDEVEKILALPDIETAAGLRDRALLEVLYASGLRRSELAALEVYDIHRSRRTLTVRLGKGKKDRVIPLGWLTAYLHRARGELQRGFPTHALFMSHKGEGLTPNAITNLTSAYVKRSGIDKPGACHLFRHAMATQMLENGEDVRWIQAMLGHASPETTQIYTQVSIGALQAVHAATHPAEQANGERLEHDDDVGLLADLMAEENETPHKRG
ncbi:tyrosine-type recombinase/integrase [Martelella alba]|uniref:tyrosine-type recombinase/integrase n=1 Tax=Martelella alba TaxID=2590451 RepID=UPI001E361F50|nr:tyrosine-type recombinase/integrase [Martelella alba]